MRGKKTERDSSPRIHCGWLWEERGVYRERRREVTNEKRRREEGEQQFDLRLVSSHLLYTSFLSFLFSGRAASELFGAPGGRLLQGHACPERGEILSAAHVRSLEGTHAQTRLIRCTSTLFHQTGPGYRCTLFPAAFQGASRTTKPLAGPPAPSSSPPAPPPPP